MAWFDHDQVIQVSGERSVFDGLEIDGVGNDLGFSTKYHFCPVCGATVYWSFDSFPETLPDDLIRRLERTTSIGVGSFVDPEFPPPTMQLRPELHPTWLRLHPGD